MSSVPGDSKTGSKPFLISPEDLKKVFGWGFLLAMVGAATSYLTDQTETLDNSLLGATLVAVLPVAVNFLRKWVKDNS